MDIEIKHINAGSQIQILALAGRLDAHTAPQLRDALQGMLDQGYIRLLVDMAEVSFVDSTGLSTLVSGMKHCCQKGGDLALTQLRQPVRIIFELTRLDKAFEIHTDRAAALAAMGR
jgi:anti-sigma B factor antagonist